MNRDIKILLVIAVFAVLFTGFMSGRAIGNLEGSNTTTSYYENVKIPFLKTSLQKGKIGRASCRERV